MALPKLHTDERYSYADYLTWPDGERWELIDGLAFAMSPSPGLRHQEIVLETASQLKSQLQGSPCKAIVSPFDVRLSVNKNVSDNYVDTVLQPDIIVVCDKSKLDERGCNGAPDIVIEVLSPSTAARDTKEKFEIYQKHGVKEYWIVHPVDKTLLIFKIEKSGKYGVPERYADRDQVQVPLLGELTIDLKQVFAE